MILHCWPAQDDLPQGHAHLPAARELAREEVAPDTNNMQKQ